MKDNFVQTWEWVVNNKEWLFSGGGITILILFLAKMKDIAKFIRRVKGWVGRKFMNIGEKLEKEDSTKAQRAINVLEGISIDENELNRLKRKVKILFIDDDSKFKVVSILKNAGWMNTHCVPDVGNFDDQIIKDSDIIFVDVQGVGKELGYKDEGLGLASSIKKRYSRKKVVIYSAITKGERFHEALRIADDSLDKNADPYEFLSLVEQYAIELYAN